MLTMSSFHGENNYSAIYNMYKYTNKYTANIPFTLKQILPIGFSIKW